MEANEKLESRVHVESLSYEMMTFAFWGRPLEAFVVAATVPARPAHGQEVAVVVGVVAELQQRGHRAEREAVESPVVARGLKRLEQNCYSADSNMPARMLANSSIRLLVRSRGQ